MRRKDIRTYEAGKQYLEGEYLEEHNERLRTGSLCGGLSP
jgi:hypothetical protein